MKLYPLYEFPPTLDELEKLLQIFDLAISLSVDEAKNIISQLFGKRGSRTSILLKDLKKIGLVEVGTDVSLTWESQLYIDLNRKLDGLLLHNVFKLSTLFDNCKIICEIDPHLELSNRILYYEILKYDYEIENERTVVEKIYAIKRLIKSCQSKDENNPFKEYENYIQFLNVLQSEYLKLVNTYQKNAVITVLEEMLYHYGYSKEKFHKYILRLYLDPVFATYTSFSTVNIDFAKNEYFTLMNDKLYYLKIKKGFGLES